jgi:7-methyl-GTP pyrophosphatase
MPFQVQSPDVDESAVEGESAHQQVKRLACIKAETVGKTEADALIIGSDQLATCNNTVLGKPGTHAQATSQLRLMRGETLLFHTGLCLLNTKTGKEYVDCVEYQVHFRRYTNEEIERYLISEQPYNCAGSFKSEELGISLVESMEGQDPTALVGLPLIKLTAMLRQENIKTP